MLEVPHLALAKAAEINITPYFISLWLQNLFQLCSIFQLIRTNLLEVEMWTTRHNEAHARCVVPDARAGGLCRKKGFYQAARSLDSDQSDFRGASAAELPSLLGSTLALPFPLGTGGSRPLGTAAEPGGQLGAAATLPRGSASLGWVAVWGGHRHPSCHASSTLFSIARWPPGHDWSRDERPLPPLMENRTGRWPAPKHSSLFLPNQHPISNVNRRCYVPRLRAPPDAGMFHAKGETGPGCDAEIDGTVTPEPRRVARGLAERACETSCKLYKWRQVLSKLPKDPPRKNGPFWKVPRQIRVLGSAALQAADQSNGLGQLLGLWLCSTLTLGQPPAEWQSPFTPGFRKPWGSKSLYQQPNSRRRLTRWTRHCYAWRELSWALFETLHICEQSPISWRGQPTPQEI